MKNKFIKQIAIKIYFKKCSSFKIGYLNLSRIYINSDLKFKLSPAL